MPRLMHDAVYAANIPTDAEMVAGYIDAGFAWSPDDWGRFPHAVVVRIVIDPSIDDGHVLDIEPGNWEPPSAPAWCHMRRAAGVQPTIYTMASWWDWCRDEFDKAGEPQPHYWIADWDGDDTLPTGVVAKQYANGDMNGTGYDLNVVADHWPGVDEETDMPTAKEIAEAIAQYEYPVSEWAVRDGIADDGDQHWARTYWRNAWQWSKLNSRKMDELIKAVAKGNDITADDISEALAPQLSDELLPLVADAVSSVLDDEHDDTAQQIVDAIGERLAGKDSDDE